MGEGKKKNSATEAITEAYNSGVKPYIEEKIGYEEAFDKTVLPFKRKIN